MADVDASFVYQVFDISKRKRKPDIHHHRKADDLWAGSDVPKWTAFCHPAKLGDPRLASSQFALARPFTIVIAIVYLLQANYCPCHRFRALD